MGILGFSFEAVNRSTIDVSEADLRPLAHVLGRISLKDLFRIFALIDWMPSVTWPREIPKKEVSTVDLRRGGSFATHIIFVSDHPPTLVELAHFSFFRGKPLTVALNIETLEIGSP